MASPNPARTSAEPITAVIAERVRLLREDLNLSQGELAEALDAIGVPWKRATVVNLEARAAGSRGQGRGRDAVSVEELLGLALVLGVPPVGLLYDLRSNEDTPVTSQVSAPPMEAALWTIGRRPLPEGAHDPDNWHDTAGALEDASNIAAAIATLQDLINIRERGILRATVDDEDVYDEEAAARMDRRLLKRIEQSLKALKNTDHPRPALPEFVYHRAKELDVKLPRGS